MEDVDFQFSDRETCAWLEKDPEGRDVYVGQALRDARGGRGIDENAMALWCAVRVAREWGASRVVGVLHYLAYSRQDKPTRSRREPTTARLVADLNACAGMDRLVRSSPAWRPSAASTASR
ncbi:MAG: ribose-phosphate pyrophosphokinase-like domain-containing protein [Deferrisomatales bacterium]|nr:ribose-phosphate pyrophosphokinase-like domain-containing protein [Deferrisomatales bacterium]